MRRMRPGVCALVIGSLALAAGCKPNLRVKGPVGQTLMGPDVQVKLTIENDGKRHAKRPFKVGFRRHTPPSTVWKFVPFGHGLAKGKEREIKVKVLSATTNDKIEIVVDHGHNIKESDEGDNRIVYTVQ